MLARKGNVRWLIILLVMLGSIINYLSRSIFSVAAPTFLANMGATEREYGIITVAFQLGIMMQAVTGYILDRLRLRKGFTLFAMAWAFVTLAQGFVTNWIGFVWLKGFQGFVEGVAQPGGLKVVSEWFPARERGMAGGIYNIGASIGSMLAPPLVAWAILTYNWRLAFGVAAALAFVWGVVWFFFYESPDRHRRLKATERDYIFSGQERDLRAPGKPSCLRILTSRNFWGIALPRIFADPAWGVLLFWMPLYLTRVRGFDIKSIALYGWLPFVAADIGCLVGPALVLWIQQSGMGLINARRCIFTLGAFLMTGVIFVGYVASPAAAMALLCLAAFSHQILSVTVITMSTDLFPSAEVATVAGMAGAGANFSVLLFSMAIGLTVLKIGYGPFFIAIGCLDLVGAALLWCLVRPRPDVESPA